MTTYLWVRHAIVHVLIGILFSDYKFKFYADEIINKRLIVLEISSVWKVGFF
jgi:hypothetical protein